MPRRRDIGRLHDEIEELFADLWQVPRFTGLRRGLRPDVDCFRSEDPAAITVVLELPGIDPDDVHVDATPTALVVSGERRRRAVPGRIYQMEIEYGAFQRAVVLPEEVDVEKANATYESGLLTIVLPIAQRTPEAVKVPIEVQTRD
jgi:HSP20 family protein